MLVYLAQCNPIECSNFLIAGYYIATVLKAQTSIRVESMLFLQDDDVPTANPMIFLGLQI
jgi:hypothetical protein